MAEVNDKGEVTVEGEFVGKLDGFRFSQDKAAAARGQNIKRAQLAALAPHFHLRRTVFITRPIPRSTFTEQGGLMWGRSGVGKLVPGRAAEATGEAFVDDEAGADVAQKVQRRLQHFIDRKVAAAFEPLCNFTRRRRSPVWPAALPSDGRRLGLLAPRACRR